VNVTLKELCRLVHFAIEVVTASDCNPGIEFSTPGSGIEKFVILGSRFGIRLTEWSSFWYPQLTFFTM